MQEDSTLQTNAISLKPKLPISRFRSSATDFASLHETDDRIELSSPQKFREPILADDVDTLVGIKECRKLTGLRCREILLGVSPSPRHRATLRGYLRLCHGNVREVQDVIIHDLRSYLEIGARHFAADQLIVLRLFLADQLRVPSRTPVTLPEATVIDMAASGKQRR
ncbi:MAG: hypothetical protein WBS22_00915 [Methylocystis sp.]